MIPGYNWLSLLYFSSSTSLLLEVQIAEQVKKRP